MAQSEDEKKQAAAEKEIAELRKKLEAAEDREAQAGMKVAELEAQIEAAATSAPAPVPFGGTITVNAAGEVVS